MVQIDRYSHSIVVDRIFILENMIIEWSHAGSIEEVINPSFSILILALHRFVMLGFLLDECQLAGN